MSSLSYKLPKTARIKSKQDFKKISCRGYRVAGKYIIIDGMTGNSTCLGITVSRHFGKAHQRNRFKRLVREAFRLNKEHLPPNLLFNVRPRPYARHATLENITQELIELASSYV